MTWSSVFVFPFGDLFFFKQKTAYEMRISDWSSDVCSSDLGGAGAGGVEPRLYRPASLAAPEALVSDRGAGGAGHRGAAAGPGAQRLPRGGQGGAAACPGSRFRDRKSVG